MSHITHPDLKNCGLLNNINLEGQKPTHHPVILLQAISQQTTSTGFKGGGKIAINDAKRCMTKYNEHFLIN